MSITQIFKKLAINIFILLMLFQAGCASKKAQIGSYFPPEAQANYCSEYLCLALAPLFKEDSFVTPEITKLGMSNSRIVYSLDYKNYGLIRLEVIHKNRSSPCTNPEAFVQLNLEKRIAYDVNCFGKSDTHGKLLKITYFPNQLNRFDEFKFLYLITHVWVGKGDENDIDGKSSLSLKNLN